MNMINDNKKINWNWHAYTLPKKEGLKELVGHMSKKGSFNFFFFLLNAKYHFRNELLKLTRYVKQTGRPLKLTFMAEKSKNMKAETI